MVLHLNDQQCQKLSEDFLPAFKDATRGKRKKIVKNAVATILPAGADSAMQIEMCSVGSLNIYFGFHAHINIRKSKSTSIIMQVITGMRRN